LRFSRRLDRADPAIVRRVHVAHLEAGALAGQAARAQRGNAALVGHLGQRVVLVHELGQLAGTEEFLDGRGDRLGIDQLLRHQAFRFRQAETFLHRTLDTHQTNAEDILGHLPDAADAAVAKVIDVIDEAVAVADIDQDLHDVEDVFR